MPNILEILARAQSLKQETALNSITPNRAGGIMYDTLIVLNQMQLEGGSLLISKIYASVAAMEADTTPTSDLTGRALRAGQLVVIVPADTSSADLGSVYRYNGQGSWSFTGRIGSLPLDTVPTQGSNKAITSGAVYTALTAMKNEGYKYMGIATPGDSGTSPGTPHQPVFYVAGPGTYPNFGGLTVAAGYLGFLSYSGSSWSVQSVAVGKDYDDQISQLDGEISQLALNVDEVEQNLDFIDETVPVALSTIPSTNNFTAGAMIVNNGVVSKNTSSTWSSYVILGTTTPIHLKPGDVVLVAGGEAFYTNASVSVITKVTDFGTADEAYECLVKATGLVTTKYIFEAMEEMDIFVSGAGGLKTTTKKRVRVKSASEASFIKDCILSESFTVSSCVRDGDGNVSSASIVYPDGKTGTLTITRDADGNATAAVFTYGTDTYTLSITRDADGNVISTSLT